MLVDHPYQGDTLYIIRRLVYSISDIDLLSEECVMMDSRNMMLVSLVMNYMEAMWLLHSILDRCVNIMSFG
jgi:hypothetical protein